jgi:hypothetical protein
MLILGFDCVLFTWRLDSGHYTRVPPAARDRSRSGTGSGDLVYNYGTNNHTAWVDDSFYNGPSR